MGISAYYQVPSLISGSLIQHSTRLPVAVAVATRWHCRSEAPPAAIEGRPVALAVVRVHRD
jgi:hypothetical protein